MGSGCGSAGKAVAIDNRNLPFKPCHRPNFIYQLYISKDKNEEKEDWNGPIKKKALSRKMRRLKD